MWLFTRNGFFSIVRKRGEDLLTVRARDKADLEALRTAYGLETKVIESGLRTTLPAQAASEEGAQIMAAEVMQIDYPNFKDTQTK